MGDGIIKYKTQRETNSISNLRWRENLKISQTNKKLTEEHKKKIRESCKGINKGRKRPDLSAYNRNRKGVFKHKEDSKAKIMESTKETWKDGGLRKRQGEILRKALDNPTIRKKRSELMTGKANPAYLHGKSRLPYPLEFNRNFKDKVRKKYDYTCQLCGLKEGEIKNSFYKKHAPHHINYIPEDLREINFILLCHECNKSVNWDRSYWFSFFCYLKNIEPEFLINVGVHI